MSEAGVFAADERCELLDGWIIPRPAQTPPHATVVGLAHDALRGALPAGWRVRIRSAITTADSEPEPDLTVVRGVPRAYLSHHPGPPEIDLVIEVADSSLAEDRQLKGRIYGRAVLPIYGIINLVDQQVEVYTDPTGPAATPGYRQLQAYGPGDFVPLIIGGQEIGRIAARELLPGSPSPSDPR